MVDKKKAPKSLKPRTLPGQKTLLELFPAKRNHLTDAEKVLASEENANALPGVAFPSVSPSAQRSLIALPVATTEHSGPSDEMAKTCLTPIPAGSLTNHPEHPAQIPFPEDGIIEVTHDGAIVGPSFIDLTQSSEEDPRLPINPPKVGEASLSSDVGSGNNPIVLDLSSPLMPPAPPKLVAKPSYPIFSSVKAKATCVLLPDQSPDKNTEGIVLQLQAPFPGAGTQHVKGPQSLYTSPALPFMRWDKGRPSIATEDYDSLALLRRSDNDRDHLTAFSSPPLRCRPILSESNVKEAMSSIPAEHAHVHPAIASLLVNIPGNILDSRKPSQKLWTEKWHPPCAPHVLGNERHALYLRDWLCAHKLDLLPAANQSSPIEKTTDRKFEAERKRSRVQRAISKKVGRKKRRIDSDDERDWIVTTDEEEGPMEVDVDSDDDFELIQKIAAKHAQEEVEEEPSNCRTIPPTYGQTRMQNSNHDFVQALKNAIILAGPPGVGKTAAVYACAEELDWEVFEVYPGIAKRNGASLNNMVGDVGKNHLARNMQSRKRDGGAKKRGRSDLSALFRYGKDGRQEPNNDEAVIVCRGAKDEPVHVGIIEDVVDAERPRTASNFGFLDTSALADHDESGHHDKGRSQPNPRVRQSMILLEEVDIVFKDDVNFWPSVINLIKDSRRPIVMTCNDISLIPTCELPLQAILPFQPCPSSIATSYLQAICIAEGHLIEREPLCRLYESTYLLSAVDMPDEPMNPRTESTPLGDLRRTIQHLQLYCSVDYKTSEPIQNSLHDVVTGTLTSTMTADTVDISAMNITKHARQFNNWQHHADLLSFTDSYLYRTPLNTPEGLGLNQSGSPSDFELGHIILLNPSANARRQEGLEFHHHDEAILDDLLGLSYKQVRWTPTSMITSESRWTRSLFKARIDYQCQMMQALESLIPLSAPLMPRAAVFMDYEPFVRDLLATDDLFERQQEIPGPGRQKRTTRSSQQYERWLPLSDEHRRIIWTTRLRPLEE